MLKKNGGSFLNLQQYHTHVSSTFTHSTSLRELPSLWCASYIPSTSGCCKLSYLPYLHPPLLFSLLHSTTLPHPFQGFLWRSQWQGQLLPPGASQPTGCLGKRMMSLCGHTLGVAVCSKMNSWIMMASLTAHVILNRQIMLIWNLHYHYKWPWAYWRVSEHLMGNHVYQWLPISFWELCVYLPAAESASCSVFGFWTQSTGRNLWWVCMNKLVQFFNGHSNFTPIIANLSGQWQGLYHCASHHSM